MSACGTQQTCRNYGGMSAFGESGHRPAAVHDHDSGGRRGVMRELQQGRNFRRRNGLAEQVALPFRASILLETCQLLGIFHTFGGCRQAKSSSKSEDGA